MIKWKCYASRFEELLENQQKSCESSQILIQSWGMSECHVTRKNEYFLASENLFTVQRVWTTLDTPVADKFMRDMLPDCPPRSIS